MKIQNNRNSASRAKTKVVWKLGRYEHSPPSTKELHASAIKNNTAVTTSCATFGKIEAEFFLTSGHTLCFIRLTTECRWFKSKFCGSLVSNARVHSLTLYKGKYHGTADLLFCLFGLSCFAYVKLNTDLLVWSNFQTSKTGGQQYSWYSPYKISEYCLWPIL